MSVDLTPILVAAIYTLGPIVLGFAGRSAFKMAWPELVKYLGEKNALSLQERVNQVLNAGIGFAVQKGAEAVLSHGGITVETKSWLAGVAVDYASRHAPELMTEAGDVLEKVLARFDAHPAVQGLVAAANDNAAQTLAKAA